MKLLKSIFSFFWALWGCFWFAVVVTIFTILYALLFTFTGKKYLRQCIWMNCHYLCPFLLKVCFIRLKVHGLEHISSTQPYVVVANHCAQIDILISGASVNQPVRFLAKSEIKNIPFFGYMTKMLAIMVDRNSKESREKSVQYLREELAKGFSLLIYPEGTRNRTDQPLKEFKDGAFRIAIETQMPIAVQTIVGATQLNNPKGLQLFPGTVSVYWSNPIETKGMSLDDLATLKQRVQNEMLKYL